MTLRIIGLNRRWGMAVLLVGVVLMCLGPFRANAAQAGTRLIMVEQAGCRYCIEWDREIAPGYGKSQEGRFAPLKRVQRGDAILRAFKSVVYTPTFIVVRDGREMGRVTGYAGKIFFWEELNEELLKAGFKRQGIPGVNSKASAEQSTPLTRISRSIAHDAR